MKEKYQGLVERAIALGALDAKLTETDRIVFDPTVPLQVPLRMQPLGQILDLPSARGPVAGNVHGGVQEI